MQEVQKNLIKKILVAIILTVMGLVIFQDLFQFKKVLPLAGYYNNPPDVSFSWKHWKTGKYQKQKDEFLAKGFKLREDFVRLHNTLQYELFKTTDVDWIVFGKQHHLLDRTQIDAFLGKDTIGEPEIKRTVYYLKQVQDTLSKLGKFIYVVVPPNKPTIYPEFTPKEFGNKTTPNNYDLYSAEFRKNQINYIDLVEYFHQLKKDGTKDVFAINGTHWNTHGAALSFIYTLNYINKTYHHSLGNIEITGLKYLKEKPADLGVYVTLNMFSTTTNDSTLSPEIKKNISKQPKPKTLFISDSFFDEWIDLGAYDFFDSTTYYFYNDRIIMQNREVTQIGLTQEEYLEKYDMYIIMCNESNLDNLGWKFIHQLYFYFYPLAPERILYDKFYQKRVKKQMKLIKEEEEWYKLVEEKAKASGTFIDKQLYLDAAWMIEREIKAAKK